MTTAEAAAYLPVKLVPPPAHQPAPVELRAQSAAARLGTDIAEVERLPFDLSALEADGIFVVRRATCG